MDHNTPCLRQVPASIIIEAGISLNSCTSWNFFEWLPLLGFLLSCYISNSNTLTLTLGRPWVETIYMYLPQQLLSLIQQSPNEPFQYHHTYSTLPPFDLSPTPRKDPRK